MKRGLASPCVHSAFAITRRERLQLSSVDHAKSLKARAGRPVASASGCEPRPARPRSRPPACGLRARPSTKCTSLASHQLIKSSRQKPAVGADDDRRLRPARTHLRHDARHLLNAACRGVDVGRPQLGAEQVPPPEHEQRQIAVAVVIAVEEAALLVAVQGTVRGIEIDHHRRGRHAASSAAQCRRTPARSPPHRG